MADDIAATPTVEEALAPTLEETLAALRRQLANEQRRVRLLDAQNHVLERERQKLAALMHHADAGFVVFDEEQKVSWTNAQFVRGFGHDSHMASFLGSSCHHALCGRERRCDDCPLDRAIASGKTEHSGISIDVHGEARDIYVTVIPIKSMMGDVAEAMAMLQDVSELRRG